MTPFRDSQDPVVRLRIATEGALSDSLIIRLLDAAQSEQCSRPAIDMWFTNLVENLLRCGSADDAMTLLAETVFQLATVCETTRKAGSLPAAPRISRPKTPDN